MASARLDGVEALGLAADLLGVVGPGVELAVDVAGG